MDVSLVRWHIANAAGTELPLISMESRILKYSSLVWNILNKLFPGRKVPRGRTESAVPPLDSTLALPFLERRDCGVEECINFAGLPGWVGCEMGVIF